jgi:predicted small lipoprotein YifL
VKKSVLALCVLFLAAGCGEEEAPPSEQNTEPAQQETTANEREIRRQSESAAETESRELPRRDEEDPAKEIPKMSGQAEESGYGLTMVVNGSSPEAFRESLELIAEDATQAQYRQLDSALRFLGTYDPAAWSGLPELYESLDGMTGEEIIERARRMRDERRD